MNTNANHIAGGQFSVYYHSGLSPCGYFPLAYNARQRLGPRFARVRYPLRGCPLRVSGQSLQDPG